MIIQFNTGKTDIVLIKRPEWYVSHTIYMGCIIFKVHNEGNFISTKAIENPVLCRRALEKHNPSKDYKDVAIKLPDGDWADIGNPFELSEEQAAMIVPDKYSDESSAIDAWIAFIHDLRVYQINPYSEKRPKHCFYPKDRNGKREKIHDGFQLKWDEYQKTVGNWILLTAVKA